MLSFRSNKHVRFCDGLTRRDFLRAGALSAGTLGLSLADLAKLQAFGGKSDDINCILLFLVGGPSHLDTFDLKPNAPDNIRGPFRPIRTNVPGIDISEHLPLMAQMAHRYSIVRSVHHDAAPIHETGQQLMQTGRLFRSGVEHPHYGSVVSKLRGRSAGLPASVMLPGPIGNTGVSVSHGQTAGYLSEAHEPFCLRTEPSYAVSGGDPARLDSCTGLLDAVDAAQQAFDASQPADDAYRQAFGQIFAERAKTAFDLRNEPIDLRARYGFDTTFGQSCLLARRLVEHGVKLVTVNMFDTVFNNITWDCHADGGALSTTLDDYRTTLCPIFDQAYTALLEDLAQRGMLENTLVVAMGEFGRTPQMNNRGGRDHWPGVWSILFAGGKVQGGQVIGSSDKHGTEPRDRPVTPAEVAASVYAGMGIDVQQARLVGPENRPIPLADAEPVAELFRG